VTLTRWADKRATLTAWFALLALSAAAADLKPSTLEAWDQYVQTANSRLQERLQPGGCFLWIDESPERAAQVRNGQILIYPVGPHTPKRVPGGLIHDWGGAAYYPNAKIQDVFRVTGDYAHYKDIFHPGVISAQTIGSRGTDRYSMTLADHAVFQHNAIEGEFESKAVRVDAHRWYSITWSTRMQQIDDYGEPGEHQLPVDSGDGFIWRLYSITRYEERDGGVYAEVEALGLSRDIPASLRWAIDPIIRRISKSSLMTSIRQTRDAVDTTAARGPAAPSSLSTSFRQR